MSDNGRYVTKHPKGWAVKSPGGQRAGSVHSTQKEAEKAAKQTVSNLSGGEVCIQGRDGRWRDSDTAPPETIRTRRATRSIEATAALETGRRYESVHLILPPR